jgi:hypothetical protein
VSDLVDRFALLFQGRLDAVGDATTKLASRIDEDNQTFDYFTFLVDEHLDGGFALGVYPLLANLTCWWGCIDFDDGEDESFAHAANVQLVLGEFEVASWPERSRSKGYHLWVFFTDAADGGLVREALLGACQTVGAPTREINPKNAKLPEGSLGNYVRLPYPGGRVAPRLHAEGQVVLDTDGSTLPLDEFVNRAWERRTKPNLLHAVRELYRPPVRMDPAPPAAPRPPGPFDPERQLSPLAWKVYVEGPLDGMGRGHTLYKLARLIREEGRLSFDEAFGILSSADARWGKFLARPDGERQLRSVLESAW